MITPIKFLSEVKPGETFSEDASEYLGSIEEYIGRLKAWVIV